MYKDNELYEINIDKLAYSLENNTNISVNDYIEPIISYKNIKFAFESFNYTLNSLVIKSTENFGDKIKFALKRVGEGLLFLINQIKRFFWWIIKNTIIRFIKFLFRKRVEKILKKLDEEGTGGNQVINNIVKTTVINNAITNETTTTRQKITKEDVKKNLDMMKEQGLYPADYEFTEQDYEKFAQMANNQAAQADQMRNTPEYKAYRKKYDEAVARNASGDELAKIMQDYMEGAFKKLDFEHDAALAEISGSSKGKVFKEYKMAFTIINSQALLSRVLSKNSLFGYFMNEFIHKDSTYENTFGKVRQFIEYINSPDKKSSLISDRFKEDVFREEGYETDTTTLINNIFGIKLGAEKNGSVPVLLQFKNSNDPKSSYFYPILSEYKDIIRSADQDEKELKTFIQSLDKLAKSIPGIKEVSWKIDQEQIEYLKEELDKFSKYLNFVSANTNKIIGARTLILQEIVRLLEAWAVDNI